MAKIRFKIDENELIWVKKLHKIMLNELKSTKLMNFLKNPNLTSNLILKILHFTLLLHRQNLKIFKRTIIPKTRHFNPNLSLFSSATNYQGKF